MYGLKSTDGQRAGPARERIGFMTNSPCVVKRLNSKCPNTQENKPHDHVILINGRAKAPEVYPPTLRRAVCEGFMEQIEMDRMGQFLLAEVNADGTIKGQDLKKEAQGIQQQYRTMEEEDQEALETAWDDVSGAALDPSAVKRARAEEIDYIRNSGLCTKVSIDECYKKIGRAPISVRWIDINKGDTTNPNYRSRLVAKEINTHKRDDLFAGTPPLEALKCIRSIAANSNMGGRIMVNDVNHAFFHAKARRDVYVQIAAEDAQPGDEKRCGKLNYSMYGTRDAAQNWTTEYAEMLVNIRFVQGKASPCVFHYKERNIINCCTW